MSVTELAAACSVSRPTAEDVAEGLLQQGWAEEAAPDPSRAKAAGRPARRFRFRAIGGYVVGVDIGSHVVHVLVADLVGTVVGSGHETVDALTPAGDRIAAVQRAFRAGLKAAGISRQHVLAMVVGTTGIVDAGRIVIANWPGWRGLDLALEVGRFAKVPVLIRNDLRLGAVAERWRGAATGADDIVYLQAGLRMGSTFLSGGRTPQGFHGAAGEMTFRTGLRWIDAYNRLVKHPAATRSQPDTSGVIPGLEGDAAGVFDAASAGDEAARDAVKVFAKEIVKSVEVLVVTVDPELVVIGGSLSRAGEYVAEPIRRHLAKHGVFEPRVVVSPLGDEAVALGAVRVALDDVDARLFTEGGISDTAPNPRTGQVDAPVRPVRFAGRAAGHNA